MMAFTGAIENEDAGPSGTFRGAAERPPAAPSRAVRRAAEDASRRSFLRLVSHELRTPLNSIIGFSEIIARELHGPISDQRYREHAEIVRSSGLKLLKLVNDVIEIARLESGVVDLDLRPEEPLAILEDVAEDLASEAAAREVVLVVEPGSAPKVRADDRALKAALGQLVENAIAFSPRGGTVRLRVHPTAGGAALEVADDGPGVPIQDLQRILRPFEQGGDSLTRHSEGAGLGLPIARLLAEAMGGRLRLACEPGQGLRALIFLKAADTGAGPAAAQGS